LGGGDSGDLPGSGECVASVAPICGGVEVSGWGGL